MKKKTGMSSELTLDQLEFLAGDAAAEFLEMKLPAEPLACQKKLRKSLSPEQAQAVAALRKARKKARDKFPPEIAEKIFASDTMLQQASSLDVAAYKAAQTAKRFTQRQAVDICSGMGVDAIALSLAGFKTKSYDISPEAVFCGARNAEIMHASCEFIQSAAEDVEIPADAIVHIDPDRRATGRRSPHLRDYCPGEDFLLNLIETSAAGVMKLSPALPREELELFSGCDIEYVSTQNVCRQLLLWWPGVGRVTATALTGAGQNESISAGDEPADVREDTGKYIIEPDRAVLAAGAEDALAGKLGAWRLCENLVWLFADSPSDTPLARSFEILDQVPGRPGDVKKALAKFNTGQVELKTRGISLDTDSMQKKLSGHGDDRLTVMWCRTGHKQLAFITRRV